MAVEPENVGDILDRIEELAEDERAVAAGDVVESLGNRGFGPLLTLVPLIEISPIGGIPGVPTALAIIIILFAGQLALGRKHPWLPGFLQRRSIRADQAKRAVETTRAIARFMDRWFHGRLPALTGPVIVRIGAVATIILCLCVPPLELLPFATTGPMLAIAAYGLAVTVRDGVLMILAIAVAAGAVALGVGLVGANAG